MRSKLTKTIILIVFVVFLGINDVNAETCTFWRDPDRSTSEYYIIELDSNGNLVMASYQKRNSRTKDLIESKDMTSSVTVTFKKCSDVEYYTFNGNSYHNNSSLYIDGNINYGYTDDNRDDNPSGNPGSVGFLDPSESTDGLVSCGEITDIPKGIPNTTKVIYTLLQIGIPIALVIFGMLDLMKSVSAQKEDEIKKGQQTLIKRVVSAAIVFFVFAIVKALSTYLADNTSVGECLNCFIKGDCNANVVEGEEADPSNSNEVG